MTISLFLASYSYIVVKQTWRSETTASRWLWKVCATISENLQPASWSIRLSWQANIWRVFEYSALVFNTVFLHLTVSSLRFLQPATIKSAETQTCSRSVSSTGFHTPGIWRPRLSKDRSFHRSPNWTKITAASQTKLSHFFLFHIRGFKMRLESHPRNVPGEPGFHLRGFFLIILRQSSTGDAEPCHSIACWWLPCIPVWYYDGCC